MLSFVVPQVMNHLCHPRLQHKLMLLVSLVALQNLHMIYKVLLTEGLYVQVMGAHDRAWGAITSPISNPKPPIIACWV